MKISKKLLSLGLSLMVIGGCTYNVDALSNIDKIQGKDRYDTAAKIAEKQRYTTAILVNSDKSLADGLSASGLSGTVGAPILLTKKYSIPNVTLDKLKGVTKVYIIGGVGSISKNIENQIKETGIELKRIDGDNRVQTSYNVSKEIDAINPVKKVILANGFKGEADAMTVAPVAVRDGIPILLTDGYKSPFKGKYTKSYVIGGTNSMSNKIVQDTNSIRIGGKDRFDTNRKIIDMFYPNAKEFYIAKSHNLVDALTGSSIAKNTPIVLVDNNSDKTILKNADKVTALGGISENVINQCIHIDNAVSNDNNNEESNQMPNEENDSEISNKFEFYQKEVVNLVNIERTNRGLKPLLLNITLSTIATTKSQDMINNNYFSHNSPTYGSPFDMMKQFGIRYMTAGENIAKYQETPKQVVTSWMNSEGHRANILNSNFKEIGIGIAKDSSGKIYWTQMFIGD